MAIAQGHAEEHERFEIQDHVQEGRHTLVLRGELDMAVAEDLERAIAGICSAPTRGIALDLAKLSFIDSTGLRAVVRGSELCREHGCEFALIPGCAAVQRVFELTGLIDVLPFRRRIATDETDPAARRGDTAARP
ncbi:MAG: STAS domain-containing protein [Solirubrobacterales bacterium]|nr:STAS domain-containing protein [Solirubrobacterales bacterium]